MRLCAKFNDIQVLNHVIYKTIFVIDIIFYMYLQHSNVL